MADRKLGRGLDAILHTLGSAEAPSDADLNVDAAPVTSVPVDQVDPNPYQPRDGIDAGALEQLTASIRQHGLLQPILVRPQAGRFQVVAGERRLRAAQALGFAQLPAIVREVPDDRMLEVALVENLQREDLDPIEKARSFRAYLRESALTQEEAGRRLGLDRSTIANMIRLLELPEDVQALVRSGGLAMGHARAILAADGPERQMELAVRVVREDLSVRQVERLVAPGVPARRKPRGRARTKPPHIRDVEARLREALGTKVTVQEGAKPGTGRIIIEFYSPEDLDRVLAIVG